MTGLSPLTRRIVAVGLLILILLLGLQLVVVPVATGIVDARDELQALRARKAKLRATEHRLLPDASTMPPGLAIPAANRTAAEARLRALITGSATIAGLHVTLAPPAPGTSTDTGPQLRVPVSGVGSEAAVIGFANLVEHGTPLIRFAQWHIEADDAPVPKIALTAVATAVWTPAR